MAITEDYSKLVKPEADPAAEEIRLQNLRGLLDRMSNAEREALWEWAEQYIPPPPPWSPLPHQQPPPDFEDWLGWLLIGGRGIGKTAAVCRAMNEHALGPPCLRGPVPHRMGIIAPTLGDASASIVHGEDGLAVINPAVEEKTRKGGTVVLWPNGAFAYLFGVHTQNDVDRLRAHTNRCFDLREEIAAWRYLKDGMAQADFGLRMGKARWIGATTPRPRPSIIKLDADPMVRKSRASTEENPYLPEARKTQLYEMYGNTQVGLQELQGLILEKVSGALWEQELIEANRVRPVDVPDLLEVRTYIDPSWGTTHDEVGIVVAGLGYNRHVYILEDLSGKLSASQWGIKAALGWLPQRIDPESPPEPKDWFGVPSRRVIYETNFQGEQVRLVMRLTAKELRRRIITRPVSASVGKRLRAEPVLWLYERGRVHHVGEHAGLEWQMTNWVPPEKGQDRGDPGDPPLDDQSEDEQQASSWSPDRVDALVFAVTDLGLSARGMRRPDDLGSGTVREQPIEIVEPDESPLTPARSLPRAVAIPQRRNRLD